MGGATPAQGPVIGPNSSYTNGANGFNPRNGNRASWAGSQDSSSSVEGERPIRPKYPHIKDLQQKARDELRVSVDSSVSLLHFWTNPMALSQAVAGYLWC